MNFNFRLLFVCLLLSITACSKPATTARPATQDSPSQSTAETANNDSEISLELALAQIKSGQAILVDVREQNEWDEKHFADAVSIPLSKLTEDISVAKDLDKSKRVYTHCRAGRRAGKMSALLKENGFDVVPLKYSFEEIAESGFELSK